jgi:hypothetical protein
MGGRNAAWQPSRARGQSSGAGVSAAALTGPRAAAQTGVPLRPTEREPVVAWTPRRHSLGGVPHGAAVDDGGVGPRPARPSDSAASAPSGLVRCLRRGQGSLGNRSGASHGRRPPRCASGWHAGSCRPSASSRSRPPSMSTRFRTEKLPRRSSATVAHNCREATTTRQRSAWCYRIARRACARTCATMSWLLPSTTASRCATGSQTSVALRGFVRSA